MIFRRMERFDFIVHHVIDIQLRRYHMSAAPFFQNINNVYNDGSYKHDNPSAGENKYKLICENKGDLYTEELLLL